MQFKSIIAAIFLASAVSAIPVRRSTGTSDLGGMLSSLTSTVTDTVNEATSSITGSGNGSGSGDSAGDGNSASADVSRGTFTLRLR